MTLPRPLARRHRAKRDDRRFVVATEDTYAPEQYFKAFRLNRVSVHIVPTIDGRSSARDVVARLKEVQAEGLRNNEVLSEDQFWVVLDTDHWSQGQHVVAFSQAIKEAREAGFHVAVTNPCFELWLLLHVADAPVPVESAEQLVKALQVACGGYSKTNIPIGVLMPGVRAALARAAKLDTGSAGWPQSTGSQLPLLITQLLQFLAD